MKANLDFDITCHLGHFRNLELPCRGVYCISISLFFGVKELQRLPPHGCFSAPLKHSSFVGEFEIPAAPLIDTCEIQTNSVNPSGEEEEVYFCSRTFVIRYRDEFLEINEGAHWRLTLPDVDLRRLNWNTHALSCPELLTMRFCLFQCDLVNVTPKSDLMKNLDKHLPKRPEFKLFATQDLHLQQASSGFHQYYPISFTNHMDVCLDAMIHCAVTKIEYTDISVSILDAMEDTSSQIGTWYDIEDDKSFLHEDHCGDNNDMPSRYLDSDEKQNIVREIRTRSQSLSKTRQRRHSVIVNPSNRLRVLHIGKRGSTSSSPGLSIRCKNCREGTLPSTNMTSLSIDELKNYWTSIVSPFICNHFEILAGIQDMAVLSCENSFRQEVLEFEDIIIRDFENALHLFSKQHSIPEALELIVERLSMYNEQICSAWSRIVGCFVRHMPVVCEAMKKHHIQLMRSFWKGQCCVHTCSTIAMKSPRHTEESMVLMILEALRAEDSKTYHDENNDLNGQPKPEASKLESNEKNNKVNPVARGLRLYDASVHCMPSKLPILVVQQYDRRKGHSSDVLELIRRGDTFRPDVHGDIHMNLLRKADAYLPSVNFFNQMPPLPEPPQEISSLVSKSVSTRSGSEDMSTSVDNLLSDCLSSEENPSRGLHHKSDFKGQYLIILVHGFQGTSYDMKMIKNAFRHELDQEAMILSSRCNERSSGDSILDMGKRLAGEIEEFVKNKCPDMLLPGSGGRVIFVGHSAGGLIIRKSLEDDRLKGLMDKLHSYMSLSTPHLGTQYGDSQLVSTGMWALAKWKKSPLLLEVAIRDDKNMLFNLSSNGVLQHFRRVIFVSSPKDMYVPLYSARVQINSRAALDPKTGQVVTEMAANLMSQIEPDRLYRVTVDNQVDGFSQMNTMQRVDKAIGRSAHICYIENNVVATQLVKTLFSLLS